MRHVEMTIRVNLENVYGVFKPGDTVCWPENDARPLLEAAPPMAEVAVESAPVDTPDPEGESVAAADGAAAVTGGTRKRAAAPE